MRIQRRPRILWFCSTALGTVMACTISAGGSSAQGKPYVVAHWLVPMDYQLAQVGSERAKDDVRAAMEEGLDGFAFDAFSGRQAKQVLAAYSAAADSIGATDFKMFLSADMGLGFAAADIVDTMAAFGSNAHYLNLNGRPLLSTYGGGKNGDGWWQTNVIDPLSKAGHPVTFVPYFDRPNPNGDEPNYNNWVKTIQSYPVIDGLFNFIIAGSTPFYSGDPNLGHHWWSTLEGEENLAKALRDQKKIFIAPYSPYYWAACHSARQYMEYQGGRGMENAWRSIVTVQKPQAVEIVTWNDYTESTYIQPTRLPTTKVKNIPSYPHLGYYELLKYYISWYHTGQRPTIVKDSVFYFYRPNVRSPAFAGTDPFCSLGPVKISQLWGNLQNVIHVTTAATAPAKLLVTTGGAMQSYDITAGLETTDVPFNPGHQLIEVWRNGNKIVSSQGIDVTEMSVGDNFNVYGAYAVAGGSDAATWKPSDAWKNGQMAAWWNASR